MESTDTIRVSFNHETTYNQFDYPDAGLRLLALYRFWNAAHYFYAYRHLLGDGESRILVDAIPEFCKASNALEYQLACLKLLAKYRDGRTNLWSYPKALEGMRGPYLTFYTTQFIDNQLVVTRCRQDKNPDPESERLLPGDIILKINGVPVEELVQRYLPYAIGSNLDAQLRYLVSPYDGFLARSKTPNIQFLISRNGETSNKKVTGFDATKSQGGRIDNLEVDYAQPEPLQKGFQVLDPHIGYICPAALTPNSFDSVKSLLKDTKAIIIDLRRPMLPAMLPYIDWLKHAPSPFATYTLADINAPGYFELTNAQMCGQKNDSAYQGKLVVLVDSKTSYTSETYAMMLASVAGAKVVGSPTAGTNGLGSPLILPGGLQTAITTGGIQYPDSTEVHGCGIKIDSIVRPTVNGIRAGRDEILEVALGMVR